MSRGGRRVLEEDERALWDNVKRSVAPLRRRKAEAEAEAPAQDDEPVAKRPRKAASPSPITAAPSPGEPPPLAPLGRRMRQKIARGAEPIDARIDLHGMTQSLAHHALLRFLRAAQRDGARVVLVITGKGARGGDDAYAERGVLRRAVPLWLESAEMRPLVIGFEDAGRGHGGQGALYVRVRRLRE